jgi:hypothetical protein
MNTQEPSDPKDINIATDLDHEVKLLAETTGLSPGKARRLINQAGNFKEALRRAAGDKVKAAPK